MTCIGRAVWVALVWLTAATTLLAGSPHFACRCPDGHIKPFCLSFSRTSSACCCGKGGTSSGQERGHPCCGGSGRPVAGAFAPGSSLDRTDCCHRTLMLPQVAPPVPHKTTAVGNATANPAGLLPHAAARAAFATAPASLALYQLYHLPPPTDLLAALQRLLI